MEKLPRIHELICALESRLGAGGWQICDHWDADRAAIGIASTADPRRLVYVSVWDRAPQAFDFECETPPPRDSDAPNPRGTDVSFEELVAAIQAHLALG